MTDILRIAVPVPLPRLFDYLPPAGFDGAPASCVGRRALVPFGRRELVGVVMAVGESGEDPRALRAASALLDETPLFDAATLRLLHWCANYYAHPIGETVATALPAALRRARAPRLVDPRAFRITDAGVQALSLPPTRATTVARRVLEVLLEGPLDPGELGTRVRRAGAALRDLLDRGLIARATLGELAPPAREDALTLNEEQVAAVRDVVEADPGFTTYLLEGVTGSGKTEVYLELITRQLAQGRQSLVLVPEIALTPQALTRYRRRLGAAVFALHSGLAEGSRAAAWLAAARGEAGVILGTRSAILAPMPRLGLIIVDEEHDTSYKQQDGLRYWARDVAVMRAREQSVPVILGSATPSLESLANARAGRYRSLRLTRRGGGARAPAVRVLDLRHQTLHDGLSEQSLREIAQTAARGEQALVFRNRRGYAPVLMCHDCGWHAECPRCDVPMTVHQHSRELRCHHCGRHESLPRQCPACGQQELIALGAGTERLEEVLRAHLPDDVPVLRVDRDTTRARGAFDDLIEALDQGGPAVLVGTQMLAKGHDLPGLTLAVIANVDEGLFSADFRGPERLAQLIVQVAGRAGRASKPGLVLLQTHHPQHELLTRLLEHGYRGFAERELEQRQALSFPPFAHLALFRAEAQQEAPVREFLLAVKERLSAHGELVLRGPLPAPRPRRAGFLRHQLVVECARRAPLQHALATELWALYELAAARRVRWSVDVDPADLY